MSINAKLVATAIILTLLSALVALGVLRSNEAAGRLATALFEQGIDPLDQLESASRTMAGLQWRFDETDPSDAGSALPQTESSELLASLSAIMRDLRAAAGPLPSGEASTQLDRLLYGINRLRAADGEVTHRLVRRELSNIASDLDAAVATVRRDVLHMHEGAQGERHAIDGFILIGGTVGFLLGLLLLLYLSRSIGRSIRGIATAILEVGGAPPEGEHPRSRNIMADLDAAIRFVEAVIVDKDAKAVRQKRESTAQMEAAIERQKQRLRSALEVLDKPFCVIDSAGYLADANPQFLDLFPKSKLGQSVSEGPHAAPTIFLTSDDGSKRTFEHANGSTFRVLTHRNPADDVMISVLEDITAESIHDQEFEHLTTRDGLTGLLNREAFNSKLNEALDSTERSHLTVIAIDIIEFRNVNSTLGLAAGDELLRQVGQRLERLAGEEGYVARLDGDEFGIIATVDPKTSDSDALCRAVSSDFARRPIVVAGRPLNVRLAIGAVTGPQIANVPEPDARKVMRDCAIALEIAKKSPNEPYSLFEPEVQKEFLERQDLERDLREGLSKGEFELHFQPIVDTARGTVSGFEALVRWKSSTRGQVSPATFIPLMEETGMIVPLGLFVLRDACRQAARWPQGLFVSINLSPRQFASPSLVMDVGDALKTSGLAPHRLQIEVTESLFLADGDGILESLSALRMLGVSIAMDDFGTGYSSLGYLSRFPFDKIKIDQSFVRDLSRKENLAIVRAMIGLGNAMKLQVIAEGVETPEQMAKLMIEGCQEMQGYLFSKPRPSGDLPRMMMQIRTGFAEGRYAPSTTQDTVRRQA